VFQNILGLSFTNAKKSDNVDHPNARSISPNVVLFWEELRYSGKAVAEDRPEATK
jgi:hypothetical protein